MGVVGIEEAVLTVHTADVQCWVSLTMEVLFQGLWRTQCCRRPKPIPQAHPSTSVLSVVHVARI